MKHAGHRLGQVHLGIAMNDAMKTTPVRPAVPVKPVPPVRPAVAGCHMCGQLTPDSVYCSFVHDAIASQRGRTCSRYTVAHVTQSLQGGSTYRQITPVTPVVPLRPTVPV